MYLATNVNRKTHTQLQAEQRRVRNKQSKDHRKKNPTVPKRKRFEHKYHDKIRELYNTISKVAIPMSNGLPRYESTIRHLLSRITGYWKDHTVCARSIKNYLHHLADNGFIKLSRKGHSWTMDILGKEMPKPSELRGKFWAWVRGKRTFPLSLYLICNKQCSSYQDLTSLLKTKEREEYTTNTSTVARIAVANVQSGFPRLEISRARDKMDESFKDENKNQSLSDADSYYQLMQSNEGRRKIGINTYRKGKGMELRPEELPLRPQKTESEMGRRREYAMTHTNVAPTPEYVQTKSEEENKVEQDLLHSEENIRKQEAAMASIRCGNLRAYL